MGQKKTPEQNSKEKRSGVFISGEDGGHSLARMK